MLAGFLCSVLFGSNALVLYQVLLRVVLCVLCAVRLRGGVAGYKGRLYMSMDPVSPKTKPFKYRSPTRGGDPGQLYRSWEGLPCGYSKRNIYYSHTFFPETFSPPPTTAFDRPYPTLPCFKRNLTISVLEDTLLT